MGLRELAKRAGVDAGNGIKFYHEVYGNGEPLVLIHGGLTTIGEMAYQQAIFQQG